MCVLRQASLGGLTVTLASRRSSSEPNMSLTPPDVRLLLLRLLIRLLPRLLARFPATAAMAVAAASTVPEALVVFTTDWGWRYRCWLNSFCHTKYKTPTEQQVSRIYQCVG